MARIFKLSLFAALALLLIACASPLLGKLGGSTSFIPVYHQRASSTVPSIELYDGWKITPAMVFSNPACFTDRPGNVKPHQAPIVLTSNGKCMSTVVRMSSLDHVVECALQLNGSQFVLTNSGVDADCKAVVIKSRYTNGGLVKFVYNLKKKYRIHGPYNPIQGH